MRDQAEVAQRLESIVGDLLVDYFSVYLPVQLLVVDVIGLERRSVPAPTEFCLRAIAAGLGDESEICGFLGLEISYASYLLEDLCNEEYIAKDVFGRYKLMRRGTELLKQEGEASPSDRRIQVLWDPVQRVILDRTIVYTKHRIDPDGIVAPISNAFAQPLPSDLEVGELNKLRNANAGGTEAGAVRFEILRVTGIQKSFGRYRPCLALVFTSTEKNLTLRMASNGSIDEDLTDACARIGLPKLIGVDRKIHQRAGVLAVKKRQENLQCSETGSKNVLQLVRLRAVLRFKLQSLTRRLSEEFVESLSAKMAEYKSEIDDVELQLSRLPLVPVRCHEVDYYLIEALKNAKSTITITSTNPSSMKIDGEILKCIQSCLSRKISVSLYIADRIGSNDATLAAIEKLSHTGSLNVQFLQNDKRAVFEIEWDGKNLLFCNEPPLGNRRSPISPREFAGHFISDEKAVSIYRSNFLSFSADDFLVKLRPVPVNIVGKQKQSQRPKSRKNVRESSTS